LTPNRYREINIDNYFKFQAPLNVTKAKLERDDPYVGMYKSDKILLIYEYSTSSDSLNGLKMYSNKPNFVMFETKINNNTATIMKYNWGVIGYWKQRFLDANFSSELSKFRYCTIIHFQNIDNENTKLTLYIYSNGDENNTIDYIVSSINFPKLNKSN
jgi:hypothetical protein